MNNKQLIRAVGEIDDDLIEEAHRPLRQAKRGVIPFLRYAAAAACFAVVFSAAMLFLPKGGWDVRVDGTEIAECMEQPLALTPGVARQAAISAEEVPLHITCGGREVTLTAVSGVLLDENGQECKALTLTRETDIRWLLEGEQDSFDLTISREAEVLVLTAWRTPKGVMMTAQKNDADQ